MSASTPRPRSSAGSKRTGSTGGAARKTTGPKNRKQPMTRNERLRKYLKYVLIAGVVGTLLLVSIFYFAYTKTKIPNPNTAFQAQTTKVLYADGKAEIGRFATQNRESVKLTEIPKVMQDAVIAAEDRSFYTNKGIDPKGILRAAFSNAKGGSTQGASTITQQYVKILYLSQERTFKRKIKEAFLSLKIQQQQSKSQILEGYLNTIYFGRGAYGVQAAANAYFGIPAKKLNASQSAMLAAILNSPNYLSPDRSKEARAALTGRYDYVLNGLVEAGAITSTESAKITGTLPKLKKATTSNQLGGQNGFMLDMVKDELLKRGFNDAEIQGGGLSVTTTFTQTAMTAAKAAVDEVRPDGVKGLHAAVASIDVKTGGLLGFYGGQDYLKSQLNWAATALPPGSAFKPFAVAAGIKDGFSLKDSFSGNSPYTFPDGKKVVNEGSNGGQDYGSAVSLTKATEQSINTAFIDLTQSMDGGPRKIADMAEALGVPKLTDDEVNARISLGGAPVSPINMANAYSGIANGGLAHEVFVVSKVTRASDGEVLYQAPLSTKRAVDKDIAADTSYAMQQVVKSGTGNRARDLGRPAAGKTGTATNNDQRVITSWFVGFTPQVATAVMYARGTGYKPIDEGYLPPYQGSTGYFGANYPTATWTAAMKIIMEGVQEVDFPPAANVDGDAPTSGHDPAPTRKPKPTKAPVTPTAPVQTLPPPSITPSLPPPDPTVTPTEPTSCGGILQPTCPPTP